jgi:hypothetical protein
MHDQQSIIAAIYFQQTASCNTGYFRSYANYDSQPLITMPRLDKLQYHSAIASGIAPTSQRFPMNDGSIADRSPKVRAFIMGETAPLKSMPSYETDLSAVGDRTNRGLSSRR